MARKLNVVRPVKLHTHIAEDLRAKIDLHLYSSLEGRVPVGAYRQFFEQLIKEYFSRQNLRLTPEHVIWGSPETIEFMKRLLDQSGVSQKGLPNAPIR